MSTDLHLTPTSHFFSKGDNQDLRLGDIVQKSLPDTLSQKDCVVLGYPDDSGIKLNGGRVGAALAPDAIRSFFYKMTPHMTADSQSVTDAGNIKISNNLTHNHDTASAAARLILNQGARLITLGGGHDYGFSDMGAFVEGALKSGKRPAVINFDAHLDVRSTERGFHSGTPFYRLLETYADRIDFFAVGIQPWCNSKHHLDWAMKKKARIIFLSDILNSGQSLQELLQERIFSTLQKSSALGLSIDIDGFSSAQAPGASQVFPVGIDLSELLKAWPLIANYKPQVLGIYEVSPPFDVDGRTAKAAAILMHTFLYGV